jgi:hypothetical protein
MKNAVLEVVNVGELISPQDYITIGAGGACVLTVIGIVWYLIKTMNPVLQRISTDTATQSEIIRNNTEAIKEVSRSNDNVASALTLLKATLDTNNKLFEKHDERAADIQTAVTRIDERTTACNDTRRSS